MIIESKVLFLQLKLIFIKPKLSVVDYSKRKRTFFRKESKFLSCVLQVLKRYYIRKERWHSI